jgi:hypothetical protein
MNASSYDLGNFIFNNEQGIYVFKTGTKLNNGPGPNSSITGPCTLQMLFNSADPVDRNIYAQQILYYGGYTYIRTCYWEQTSPGVYRTEWGGWTAPMESNRIIAAGSAWRISIGTKVIPTTAINYVKVFTDAQLKEALDGVSGTYFVCVSNGDYNSQPKHLGTCVRQSNNGGEWFVRAIDNSNFTAGNLRINYIIGVF